ncbi:Hypothetical predicted protein [Cloeon dipterum]|nr:Hypothetical predicted protein [Cloeon dipterum]
MAQSEALPEILAVENKFSESNGQRKPSKALINRPRRAPTFNEFCRFQARSGKMVDQTSLTVRQPYNPPSAAFDAQNDEALDLSNRQKLKRTGTIPFPKLPQVHGYYADFGLTTLSDCQPKEKPPFDVKFMNRAEQSRGGAVFCVVCEMSIISDGTCQHTNEPYHADTEIADYKNIAGINFPVVVPRGTRLRDELVQCVICFVVVYHQRMVSHSCNAEFIASDVMIAEGKHHYCLMCQIYFDSREALRKHWKCHHAFNEIYFIKKIRGLDTLLPKTSDLSEELKFCCDFCQVFTFKQRRHAVCVKQYK